MDFRYKPAIRIISLIVLFFFCWSFAGGLDIAYAIKIDQQGGKSNQQSAISSQSTQPKTQKPEEKFQKTIEDIEQILNDTSTDTDTKKNKLRGKRSVIEFYDTEIRKQFTATENKLKNEGLPPEILDRHYKFVKHYDDNLKELKSNLDNIEKAKTKSETDAAIGRTKAHLEKVKKPSKHVPLDPNKLPHRTAEPVFKEPRTTPEEFTEGKEQKAENIEQKQKPVLVASNGSLNGLLAQSSTLYAQSSNLPTAADLAETIEVKFTDEIKEMAGLLNNDPVLIYEFIKNNFKFEPYYGSLKGAQQTFFEQAGNDFDQASILIALLRSIGIPARYVYGTIQVPIDKAISWVGAPDALTAIKIFASNGIPVAKNPEGVITDLQIEHVWIEAFLPYDNYRGKINSPSNGRGTWIPLDPSFKQHFPNPSGLNLFQESGISIEAILQNYLNEVKTALPIKEYLSLLKSKIEQSMPDKRFYDLIWTSYIDRRELGLLPSTLEYEIIVTGYKTSEIRDTSRHKISFYTSGTTLEDGLSYIATLPEIAGKRITLSYIPATAMDENTIKQYGNMYDTSPYLIQVKPVLKVEGQIKAVGGAIGMGMSHELRQTLLMPHGKAEDVVTTAITAGAYYAIGLDPQRTSAKTLYQRADKYLQTLDTATATTDKDEIVGEFLHLLVTGYLEQKDISNKFITHTMQFSDFKKTTVAVLGVDLSISYIFSIPIKNDVGQLFLDVQRDVSNPIDMSGLNKPIRDFMIMDGMNGSFLESSIFETVFGVDGISTLKALALASSSGIPIYKITQDNASIYLPQLQISTDVKTDIVNALNRGLQVTVSQKNVQLNQWRGVGYIIENSQTGEAAYLISGGLAGGSLTGEIANVKSMIKTGSITKAQALPYIKNLAEKRQIAIPHPLKGSGSISSVYGPRIHPLTKEVTKHNGIDIAVRIGTEVIATANGIVDLRDQGAKGYGKYIIINHSLGVYTLYGHLSEFKATDGTPVKEGDVIALSGNSGASTGPHLHFSVFLGAVNNDSAIDPELFIGVQ